MAKRLSPAKREVRTAIKSKFPRAAAIEVARQVVEWIRPVCEPGYLKVAGSLRRGKRAVGDIEIVYVPLIEAEADGLFDKRNFCPLDRLLEQLIVDGKLKKRLNSKGAETWGEKNKLAVEPKSGIPVDFFATKKGFFWNYLVCRTGGERTNIRIAKAARAKGLMWHPYHGGFTDRTSGEILQCRSEEDVFAIAGLNYLAPNLRA